VAAPPPKTVSAPEKKSEPAVARPPAREVAAVPGTPATNAAPGLALTPSSPSAPQASPAPAVQTAAATPAESFVNQKTTWVAGVLLAVAACGFGWLALRRSRATAHASLITRSLNRGKKP